MHQILRLRASRSCQYHRTPTGPGTKISCDWNKLRVKRTVIGVGGRSKDADFIFVPRDSVVTLTAGF